MTSNYWVSTQCNHWLLTRTQVAIARAEDSLYATSPEELSALRIFFINCISLLAKRLFLRQRVTVTAIVFFHRFYSCSPGNSYASTDPTLVIAACVYVASKVEETPIHIRNVAQEAAKLWTDMGYRQYPSDVTALAEMEFYLLEDLQFHLVVYHPFRSLVAIFTACGKGAAVRPNFKQSASVSWNGLLGSSLAQVLGTPSAASPGGHSPASNPVGAGDTGSGPYSMDQDLAYGSPGAGLSGRRTDESVAALSGELQKVRQLDKQTQARVMQEMMDERNRMFLYAGDDDMPMPRLEDLDEQVLQMAWFVLNDSYRTDVLLIYPPHIVAVAAVFLGLVLHEGTRERMLRSKRWMDESRDRYHMAIANLSSTKEKQRPVDSVVHAKAVAEFPVAQSALSSLGPSQSKSVASQNGAESQSSTAVQQVATPPVSASPSAIPPQPQPVKSAARGLASLPPRPSHLPPKPQVSHGHPWPHQSQGSAIGKPQANVASSSALASPVLAQVASPGAEGHGPKGTSDGTANGARAQKQMNGANRVDSHPTTNTLHGVVPHVPAPPPDAMTFLASLNVDLDAVGEVVQEMLSLYDFWHRIGSRSSTAAGESSVGGSGSAAGTPHATGEASGTIQQAGATDGGISGTSAADAIAIDTPEATGSGAANSSAGGGSSAAATPNTGLHPSQSGNGSDERPSRSIYIGDAPDMFARLARMRALRRTDLINLA